MMEEINLRWLPLEMWEMILQYITDAKDVMAFLEVYPHVRETVVKVNGQKLLFYQILPILREWISPQDLLSCRLVCKNWNVGVEEYLLNSFQIIYHPIVSTPTVYLKPIKDSFMDCRWKSNSRTNPHIEFSNHFQVEVFQRILYNIPYEMNPFLGNRLELFLHEKYRQILQYQQDIVNIIGSHGHHVFYLRVISDLPNFGSLIVNLMDYLPNLKVLDIIWLKPRRRSKRSGQRIIQRLQLQEHLRTQEQLEIPYIRNLSAISGTSVQTYTRKKYYQNILFPNFIMDKLISTYYDQLVKLCVSEAEWKYEYKNLRFPKLEYFSLYYACDKSRVSNILSSISTSLASIKSLHLEMRLHQPRFTARRFVTLQEILKWVNMFPELDHFSIELDACVTNNYNLNEVDGEDVLNNNNVCTSITICWPRVHLLGPQFLCHFPKIKLATLCEHAKLYNFYNFWSGENNSVVTPYNWYNIWQNLPLLKEIDVGPPKIGSNLTDHYTRVKYEAMH